MNTRPTGFGINSHPSTLLDEAEAPNFLAMLTQGAHRLRVMPVIRRSGVGKWCRRMDLNHLNLEWHGTAALPEPTGISCINGGQGWDCTSDRAVNSRLLCY